MVARLAEKNCGIAVLQFLFCISLAPLLVPVVHDVRKRLSFGSLLAHKLLFMLSC